MSFEGSFVAIVTPFDRKGRLDSKTLERLVEWHIVEGTDGIVCSATTGEGPTLSDRDRRTIARVCIQRAAKRIPVIVATGTNDTHKSIQYTEQAKKWGADGCLVVTPYYNKPTQTGCILHFSEIAKVGLPMIIYHNPPRTAIRLSAETIAEIAKIENVIAIKESSHDLELIRKIVPLLPVFSGDDDLTFDIIKEGGVGSISVTSNLIPGIWKQLVGLCLQKKWEKAEFLSKRIGALSQALFLETNPQGIKFALSWLHKCQPVLRLPLLLPTKSVQSQIKKAIVQFALPQFSAIKCQLGKL